MNYTSHSHNKKNNSSNYSKKYIPFFYYSIIRKFKNFRHTTPKIADKESNNYEKETLKEHIKANKIQNKIAILTFVIVCVYITVGIFQHNQTKISLEYTRKADSIAEQALKLTRKDDSITNEFTKEDLRAYISIQVNDSIFFNKKRGFNL